MYLFFFLFVLRTWRFDGVFNHIFILHFSLRNITVCIFKNIVVTSQYYYATRVSQRVRARAETNRPTGKSGIFPSLRRAIKLIINIALNRIRLNVINYGCFFFSVFYAIALIVSTYNYTERVINVNTKMSCY